MTPFYATRRASFASFMLALAGCILLSPEDAYGRQVQRDFDWSGEIAPGATLRVFTFAGTVTVRQAGGSIARILGDNRNGDDDEIRYISERDGSGLRICAVLEGGECTDDGIRGGRNRSFRGSRRARADFTVEVPRGVNVRVSSGSGEVTVDGATADVRAASGSGSVRVAAGANRVHASSGSGGVTVDGARGPVEASTGSGNVRVTTALGPVVASSGSGSIDVSMASLPGRDDMRFSTGSGSITLRVPTDFSADIQASTGSGSFESDFPLRVVGRLNARNVRGTIGEGGRNVRMSTGSGSIRVLRGMTGG